MNLDAFVILAKKYRQVKALGLFLAASVFLQGIVVLYLRGRSEGVPSLTVLAERLRMPVMLLGVLFLLFIPAVYRLLIRVPAWEKKDQPIYRQPGVWPGYIAQLIKGASILLALCVMPACLGSMLYFLGRQVADFYFLAVISLLCFLFYFPRYKHWEHILRAVH